MKRILFFFAVLIVVLSAVLLSNAVRAQVIPPRASGTPSSGPTIDQAQKEDYMGPKARVAVTKFVDKSAKGHYTGQIGDGMAEMLANGLFSTNRYIVLERQSLGDVIKEQDLGASGRVKTETAPQIGEIEGADLLIEGTITEFEPGSSGAGGGVGGILSRSSGIVGGIFGGVKNSHVAMIIKVIDAKTGRRLASEQVEGKATDIGGLGGLGGGGLAGSLGGYSKTPMEKAIRVAIEESVRLIVAKTPAEYYRVGVTPQPRPQAVSSPVAQPKSVPSQPVSSAPSSAPPAAGTSRTEHRIVYVIWPKVSLREGPGTNFKAVLEVQKGTPLSVIEEKGSWLRGRLEDGQEGWIGKATTAENP
jgi:curli biogenesis system outer membrane secretion channel CsgG